MSRSQYVYVVEHPWPENADPPHVVAAFTVKYELAAWLKEQYTIHTRDLPDEHMLQCVREYVIYRLNGRQEKTFVPQSEFLA